MKKKNVIQFGVFVLFALFLTSCDVDDLFDKDDEREVRRLPIVGQWEIELFKEDGQDETRMFSGMTFDFKSDQSILFYDRNGHQISTGSYRETLDDGQIELYLTFPREYDLYELNEDWYNIENTTNRLGFMDDNDPYTDRLVLVRTSANF